MGRSKSRHQEEASHADTPEEAHVDIELPDMDAPPPPTTKQKLALAGMILVMAGWLAFLGLLVRM
jgi:hypothetical protein